MNDKNISKLQSNVSIPVLDQPIDVGEIEGSIKDISKLQSNVPIPVLDQPIDVGEIEGSIKDMKNGCFDFNLPILLILSKNFSSMLILLLNFILYIKYPIHLALSILCVIPKVI